MNLRVFYLYKTVGFEWLRAMSWAALKEVIVLPDPVVCQTKPPR